jgi:hypothetical protein
MNNPGFYIFVVDRIFPANLYEDAKLEDSKYYSKLIKE